MGHGKGLMDGIGAAIKTTVKDTISYHPEAVIRNTEQLMHYLPDLNIVLLHAVMKKSFKLKKRFLNH